MPLGGLPYNHDTAYIVVRAAKAVGAMDKAEYYADAMVARQVGGGPGWGDVADGGVRSYALLLA